MARSYNRKGINLIPCHLSAQVFAEVQMITQDLLKSVLDYCPETGIFNWKIDRRGKIKSGYVAGTVNKFGYSQIRVFGKIYKSHRLAWLYVYGENPLLDIDHINNNRLDNSIKNLRVADRAENGWNSKLSKNNTTGVKGVNWDATANSYKARISKNGVTYCIGRFKNIEDAKAAIERARDRLHGEFSNHGD